MNLTLNFLPRFVPKVEAWEKLHSIRRKPN